MSEIKLRKAPKSVSEKGMKPVVYTLVNTLHSIRFQQRMRYMQNGRMSQEFLGLV